MTPEEREVEAALLHEESQRLTRQLAEIADFSARVHDEAAAVHDDLPGRLLDPEQLRAHAAEARELAAAERERLDEP